MEVTWDSNIDWVNATKTNIEVVNDAFQLSEQNSIPDSGIARYNFDGDVTDAWGTYDGSQNGGAFVSGRDGQALSLDGVDDHVAVGGLGSEIRGASQLSVAMWMNLDSVGSSQDTFVQCENTNFGGTAFQTDGSTNIRLISDTDNNANYEDDEVSQGFYQPPSGSYEFVVWVFDSGTVEVYCNDANSQGTFTFPESSLSTNGSSTIYIGGRVNGGGNQYVAGDLDTTDFYSKSLTATEVSNLYNTGSING